MFGLYHYLGRHGQLTYGAGRIGYEGVGGKFHKPRWREGLFAVLQGQVGKRTHGHIDGKAAPWPNIGLFDEQFPESEAGKG